MVLGPLALGAFAFRRRRLPDLVGPIVVVVDVVLTLSALTVLSEALGTFGWFRTGPLAVGAVVLGTAAWKLQGAPHPRRPGPGHADRSGDPVPGGYGPVGRWGLLLVGAGIATTFGSWIARSIGAVSNGISTVDSHWYHLPIAARFVQTGRLDQVQVLDPDSVTAYFPATSSTFHAVAYLLFGSDLLSTVLNLGWLVLALTAAWSIGRPYGVSPVAAGAAALVLAGPGMVDTQPGGALTDVVGVALFLAMVAVGTDPGARRHPLAASLVVGLAGGLATGTKFTFLVPVVLAAVALVLAYPGRRPARFAWVLVGGTVTGAYWYVRNLLLTGNPLPALDLHVGPIELRAVEGVANAQPLSAVLFDADVWSEFLLPGLRDAYGPVWWALAVVAVVGMVAGVVRRSAALAALGLVALGSTVAYVFNPQYLFGGTFFATNLRYAAPGLVLALVLATVALAGNPRVRNWTAVAVGVLLLATQLDPTSWPVGFGGPSFFSAVPRSHGLAAGAILLAAALAAAVAWRIGPPPAWWARRIPVLAVLAVLGLVVGLASVQGRYLDRQYRHLPPVPDAFEWAKGLEDANIGLHGGFLAMKYPWIGPEWSNRVQYLAVATDDGGFRPPATCPEWLDVLDRERPTHVAILDVPGPGQGPRRWTADRADADLVETFPVGDSGALELYVFTLDDHGGEHRCRA